MFFLISLPRSHMSSEKYCNFNFPLVVDQFCNFSIWRIALTLIGISVSRPSYYTLVQHGRALVVMKIQIRRLYLSKLFIFHSLQNSRLNHNFCLKARATENFSTRSFLVSRYRKMLFNFLVGFWAMAVFTLWVPRAL